MPTELLIALCAGAGGMIGWGVADFLAKKHRPDRRPRQPVVSEVSR